MLQWMGGARRKVASTRKSVLNRQKQYFEQRRLQQQAADRGKVEGKNVYGKQSESKRSLDVLSFQNIAKVAQENKSTRGLESNEPEHKAQNYQTIQPLQTFGWMQTSEIRSPVPSTIENTCALSSYQTGNATTNMTSVRTPANHSRISNSDNDKNHLKLSQEQGDLSIIDLLDAEDPIVFSCKSLEREAHAAFSIEGLGEVAMETPVHTPEAHRRTFLHGCSSPSKAVKPACSFNLDSKLVDPEYELEVDVTLCKSSLEHSLGSKDRLGLSCKPKQGLFDTEELSQFNESDHDFYNFLGDDKLFFDGRKRKRQMWDGSGFIPDKILDETTFGLSHNEWMNQMDASTDYVSNMNQRKKEFNFRGSCQSSLFPSVTREGLTGGSWREGDGTADDVYSLNQRKKEFTFRGSQPSSLFLSVTGEDFPSCEHRDKGLTGGSWREEESAADYVSSMNQRKKEFTFQGSHQPKSRTTMREGDTAADDVYSLNQRKKEFTLQGFQQSSSFSSVTREGFRSYESRDEGLTGGGCREGERAADYFSSMNQRKKEFIFQGSHQPKSRTTMREGDNAADDVFKLNQRKQEFTFLGSQRSSLFPSVTEEGFPSYERRDEGLTGCSCREGGSAADYVSSMNQRKKEFTFQGSHQPKSRTTMRESGKYEPTGSLAPYLEDQRPETSHNFTHPDMTWYSPVQSHYGSRDVVDQPMQTSTTNEDTRDNVRLPSEESCSSSAVKVVSREGTLNSKEKQAFESVDVTRSEIFCSKYDMPGWEENCNKWKTAQAVENKTAKGKFTRTSNPLRSKPAHNSCRVSENRLKPDSGRLFETEFDFSKACSGHNSYFRKSETTPSYCNSKLWIEDTFDPSEDPRPYASGSCVEKFSKLSADYSPYCDLKSEKRDFHQPSLDKSMINLSEDFNVGYSHLRSLHEQSYLASEEQRTTGGADKISDVYTTEHGKCGQEGDTSNCGKSLYSKNGNLRDAADKDKQSSCWEFTDGPAKIEGVTDANFLEHAEETSTASEASGFIDGSQCHVDKRSKLDAQTSQSSGVEAKLEVEQFHPKQRKTEGKGKNGGSSCQVIMVNSYMFCSFFAFR